MKRNDLLPATILSCPGREDYLLVKLDAVTLEDVGHGLCEDIPSSQEWDPGSIDHISMAVVTQDRRNTVSFAEVAGTVRHLPCG